MTIDPELRQLLVTLGEIDAAKLWRTEAIMTALRIPLRMKDSDYPEPAPAPEPERRSREWQPRLVDDVRRPNWSGGGGANRPATDRGRTSGERGQQGRDFTRGPTDRDRGRGLVERDSGRGSYDRDRNSYGRDRNSYDRGRTTYDRGRPARGPRTPERDEGEEHE